MDKNPDSHTPTLPDTTIVLLRIPADYPGPFPGPSGQVAWVGNAFRRRVERHNGYYYIWATRAEWKELIWTHKIIQSLTSNFQLPTPTLQPLALPPTL